MKKLLILFTALFMTMSLSVMAQNQSTSANSSQNAKGATKNSHSPYMEFDKLVHDYGTIMENGDGNCVFTLTNTGREPLILTDAHSSCGCTVPQWTKSPILPGQSTEIKVEYKTSRIGPINKSVTISSNASNSPVVIRIKGNVLKNSDNQNLQKNVSGGATPVAQ